jgi:Adenylosuccinate synthetase
MPESVASRGPWTVHESGANSPHLSPSSEHGTLQQRGGIRSAEAEGLCRAPQHEGKRACHVAISAQAQVEPFYESIDSCREGTARAPSRTDLPAQAIKYARRLEELIGGSAAVLSTSPELGRHNSDSEPIRDVK